MRISILLLCLFTGLNVFGQDQDIWVDLSCSNTHFLSSNDIVVKAKIINRSEHVKHIFPDLLECTVLALQVKDDDGNRVPSIPPCKPKNNQSFVKMMPGDTLEYSYQLNIFSPELVSGNYKVLMNHFSSEGLKFTID